MKQSLVEVARTNKFEELETDWLELMISDISRVDVFLTTAEILRARSQGAKAASLLAQLSDELYSQKKWNQLKDILYYCAEKYSKMRNIRETSLECIRALNKNNSLLDIYLEKSGLTKDRDLFSSWTEFNTYSYLTPGAYVLHANQFGAGVITSADPIADKIEIDFYKKKGHSMGLQFAAKVLNHLSENHYYAFMVRDEAKVRDMLENNHAELVKIVVKSFGNEIPVSKLKDELCNFNRVNAVLDMKASPKAWTNWWAKAKKAVDKDKFLTVTNGAKATIAVREHEISYADEALGNLKKVETILDKVLVVRNFLKEHPVSEANTLLEKLDSYYPQLTNDADRIEVLTVLLEGKYKTAETQKKLDDILKGLGSPIGREGDIQKTIELPYFKTLANLKNNDAKRVILKHIQTTWPDSWAPIYQIVAHIDDIYLWSQSISGLQEYPEILATTINSIFQNPDKFPGPFYRMIRDIINGKLTGNKLPSDIEAMRKAVFVLEIGSVNPATKVLQANIPKLFAEEKCNQLFSDHLQNATKEQIEPIFRSLTARDENGESKMRAAVLRAVSRKFPEFIKRNEAPYWENENAYFITIKSKRKIEKEVEEIVNVKLPENAKHIGEAQALGDLSENAEFDAAKEERERLNGRAQFLKELIANSVLIESINRKEGRVELGTEVTIKSLTKNKTEKYKILGAQEASLEGNVLNYKAPFAWAMLGKKVGDKFSVTLEDNSQQEYVVESVASFDF